MSSPRKNRLLAKLSVKYGSRFDEDLMQAREEMSDACPACRGEEEGPCTCTKSAGERPTSPLVAHETGEAFRLFVPLSFAEDREWVPYMPKPGSYKHESFGTVKLSRDRLADFVSKFNEGVYQKEIPLDAEHQTKLSGAMAWIRQLRQNPDGSVDARVAWTDRGRRMMAEDRYKYISPEWYDSWTDPLTHAAITNVAIGGALCTRPFFKEGVLRSLVASENGWASPATDDQAAHAWACSEDESMPTPVITPEAPEQTPAPEAEAPAPVQMSEEVAKRFTEMEAKLTAAIQASEQSAVEAKIAKEKVAAAEKVERLRSFSETATEGKYVGPVADHVSLMDALSRTFGEDSAELTTYKTLAAAAGAQVATGQLFSEAGRQGGESGSNGEGATALTEMAAKQTQLMQAKPTLTSAQAFTEVINANPDLYQRYNEEHAKLLAGHTSDGDN
jgi:hypothetical protein